MSALQSLGIAPTSRASRYLQQLCKHWSHRFTVSFDETIGQVELPAGTVELRAGDMAITVVCTVADGGDIERLQKVVTEHLDRFAFREDGLAFVWRPA